MPAYDALVIGAGMSGLAAGIRLAQFDRRVLLVERHSLWGGLNSFYKRQGRRLDTGLHALTNFVPKGTPNAPLTKLLRQLRIPYDALQLGEQTWSEIRTRDVRLRFANGFGLLEEDVATVFPACRDGFARLVRAIDAYELQLSSNAPRSARAVVAEYIADPLLADLLFLPIAYYGSAQENDVDWESFVILFKSLYREGFARPEGGIKRMLDLLIARYREAGGELRMRCGVQELVVERASGPARDECRVRGAILDDGTHVEAEHVLSSAGFVETMRLAGRTTPAAASGQMTFVETIAVTNRPLAALGHEATLTFFLHGERFHYAKPDALVDLRSGVICATDNYKTQAPPTEGLLRLTSIASYDHWRALASDEYAAEKLRASERMIEAASAFVPDPRPHTVFCDVATPMTIERYTGRVNGAVYGSPRKTASGETGIGGLFLVGTDQGLLGVVGALLSGILMANRHALVAR
ncbi:MAG: phytoene desaturase family protein [Planctomycetota bacterium]